MTTIDFPTDGEPLVIRLPDGRTAHLWHHDCDECTSLDIWTETADGRKHTLSANTGKPTAAPSGVFTFANGRRYEMANGYAPQPETMGRTAHATVVLIWHDEREGV